MQKVVVCLYDRSSSLIQLFKRTITEMDLDSLTLFGIDIIEYDKRTNLREVIKTAQLDAIVSPANSYGFMYGGFDAAISEYYAQEVPGLSQVHVCQAVQKALRQRCGGYNPPMSALVIDMCRMIGSYEQAKNAADTLSVPQLIHLPTMSLPGSEIPDSPVVFHCMWNMLSAIIANNSCSSVRQITRVLVTGLGTGVGGVSEKSCVRQMCSALKLFDKNLSIQPEDFDLTHATEIDSVIKSSHRA
jgi:O-acetyl-ADP-ribose deacetylase (regulator of RNase III)